MVGLRLEGYCLIPGSGGWRLFIFALEIIFLVQYCNVYICQFSSSIADLVIICEKWYKYHSSSLSWHELSASICRCRTVMFRIPLEKLRKLTAIFDVSELHTTRSWELRIVRDEKIPSQATSVSP